MKNKCDICSCNLNNTNYCIVKKPIYSNDTFCYDCVQTSSNEIYNFIYKNIDKIKFNKLIIHLDKYNDDFSHHDYFLRLKK